MNAYLYLKPAPGLRVLQPETRPPAPLPAEGLRVPDNAYWRRRLAEGVVVPADPPAVDEPGPATPDKPARKKE